MKFKIIAYNVLWGFCDVAPSEESVVLNKERLSIAKNIISQENPDILCLTEAYFSAKNYSGVYLDYQEIFGYPYIDIRGSNMVLSKFPITFSKDIVKRGAGKALVCSIKIGDKVIPLDLIHPKNIPADENKKLEFIEELFDEKVLPKIICGDFNSLSADDGYGKDFEENFKKKVLLKISKIKSDEADLIIKDILKSDIVKYIRSKGFIDTYKVKNKNFDFTIPTDLLSKDKSTGIRMDFIFVSPDIKVIDAGIIKNSLCEKASDHYPVYAVLEV